MPTFRVPDMHCAGCVKSVTGAVRDVDAGATVDADLDSKQVRVVSAASADAIAASIREAGFDVEAVG